MGLLSKISIKSKLMMVIVTIAAITIITGSLVDIYFETRNTKKTIVEKTLNEARFISQYCIPALDFDFPEKASEILANLRAIPEITNGLLFDAKDSLFASYSKTESKIQPQKIFRKRKYYFDHDFLYLYEPIIFQGHLYGVLFLKVDTNLSDEVSSHIIRMSIIAAAMVILAIIFASLLERVISNPIIDLANFTKRISRDKDYSLRIEKQAKDEIGNLYDEFNDMLDVIKKKEDERDLAQLELEELNKKLEKKVTERTHQLEELNKKLGIALEKEKDLNNMKSRFISMVSHEYRTPLTIILSSAQLLERHLGESENEKIKKHIMKISQSVKQMTSLLEDVIIIGKGGKDVFEAAPEKVDITALVNSIAEEISTVDNNRHLLNIDYNLKDNLIYTDPNLLRHIIANLLTNAIKYSDSNNPVNIQLNSTNGKLVLTVEDKGIGLKAEDKMRLFEPFYRRKEHIGRIPGTGLGLAIIKRCVDALKGDIDVDSTPGTGSVFTVTIPLSNNNKQTSAENERAR